MRSLLLFVLGACALGCDEPDADSLLYIPVEIVEIPVAMVLLPVAIANGSFSVESEPTQPTAVEAAEGLGDAGVLAPSALTPLDATPHRR